jgi:hypothetical protein
MGRKSPRAERDFMVVASEIGFQIEKEFEAHHNFAVRRIEWKLSV